MQIILASASQVRHNLLRNAGVPFAAVPAQLDERRIAETGTFSPHQTASTLATLKALAVSRSNPKHLVIGADQVLALGNKIYSKPRNIAECRAQLLSLRGLQHILISSVSCVERDDIKWTHTTEARIEFRAFSEEFLDNYLNLEGADCLESVGGYKLEGRGIQLIESLSGDYFTVLGLPLMPLLSYLRRSGFLQP